MRNTRVPVWMRFVAPSILLLALGIAALPVLEVGLKGTPQDFDAWNKMRAFVGRQKAAADGTLVILTQNGIQAIWAGYSWGPEIAEEKALEDKQRREHQRERREQIKKAEKAFEDMARAKGAVVSKTPVKRPGPAVLMIFYFLLVISAAGLGYALPCGGLRAMLFCGTTLAAAACLALQMLIGFPIATTVPPEVTGMKWSINGPPRLDPRSGLVDDDGKTKLFVHRLFWDQLAWPTLLAALILAGCDLLLVGGSQGKTGAGGGRSMKRRDAWEDSARARQQRRAGYDEETRRREEQAG